MSKSPTNYYISTHEEDVQTDQKLLEKRLALKYKQMVRRKGLKYLIIWIIIGVVFYFYFPNFPDVYFGTNKYFQIAGVIGSLALFSVYSSFIGGSKPQFPAMAYSGTQYNIINDINNSRTRMFETVLAPSIGLMLSLFFMVLGFKFG